MRSGETERYSGLIESDWNLKAIVRIQNPEASIRINRIRLEFKDIPICIDIAICMVLIESDWNLKPFRRILTSTIASVLIKSDWNLKYVARIKSVASAKPY